MKADVMTTGDFAAYDLLARRRFVLAGGLTLFGRGLSGLSPVRAANAAAPVANSRAKSCILLFMWGGPAHQDTWDMKPEAPAEFRGEFQPIATCVPGIQICEHFPQLSQRVDKLAIVRSMTHNNGDHTKGTHYLLTGEPPPISIEPAAQWPHFGAVLSKLDYAKGALPPFVSMRPKLENDVPRFVEQSQGQFAGWLGPVYDPLTIDHDPSRGDYKVAETSLVKDVGPERFTDRRRLLHVLDRTNRSASPALEAHQSSRERAFELLTSAADERGAFDLSLEPQRVRERYGENPHGQSVLQARRLVERGVPLVTVFWPNDGIKNVSVYWDTHSRNFVDLKQRLMPVADQAFSALLDDLDERGMLDETLVVWTGEFGRTPRVGERSSDAGAGADGRDHWPGCFTSVLAGGGIAGGQVYGKSDRRAAFPAENPVAPRDLAATIYHLLGVGAEQTIPDLQGRPHYIRQGKPIEALFA